MPDEVLTERRDRVLLITLNRPEVRNAVNRELGEQLGLALDELDEDDELTAGVLAGAGKGFCAGMDLKAFAATAPPKRFARLLREGTAKPLIAAVEGFALGGGLELALICDLLVAAEGARFSLPEVSRGLFAGGGGLLRLPRRLPSGVAMEMALTGEPLTAERAFEYGLVSRLSAPGRAVDVALELATRIARNAPLAVVASKRLLQAGQDETGEQYWALQEPLVAEVFHSEDALEGARAFTDRRDPKWVGR